MRIFVKVLGVVIGLMGVALAFLLVPPHLQIGKIEPSLPNIAELREKTNIAGGPIGVRYLITSSQRLPGSVLSHSSFIIDWANGTSFVIDVGMDQDASIEFSKIMESMTGASPANFHGNIADLLGDGIQSITGMAFTHLHVDHTEGITAFCEKSSTETEVYQTVWQHQFHNFNTNDGADLVAGSCLTPVTLRGDKVLQIENFPGLLVVGLGGHTPGSTLFAVSIDKVLYIFSGDITNSKSEILNNVGKGFIYSTFFVPENTERTKALRLWLAELNGMEDVKVVVSHDLADIESSGIHQYVK
ncbi:MAG: glyoxylase-like metal-dependent hydrolase (beta-lactamase superfamily II) [Candidatus Azotimanducaceae bacterium]|jgi:glyoxylase-like metal-dependent hydrolase (beta-lactamase superfamily II)